MRLRYLKPIVSIFMPITVLSLPFFIISFPGCVGRAGIDYPRPFIEYRVGLRDSLLSVVEVEISVRGCAAGDFTLGPVMTEHGLSPEPVYFDAVSLEGNSIVFENDEGLWRIKNGGKDFNVRYGVILARVDRYSPDIRKKLSSMGDGRTRIVGRDIFLIPHSEISDGIVLDLEMGGEGEILSIHPTNGDRLILPEAGSLPNALLARGNYSRRSAIVGSVETILACSYGWPFSEDEIFSHIKDIVRFEIGMFGSSPHERYLFLLDRNPVFGSGGFDYYGAHLSGNILLLFDEKIDRSSLYGPQMSVISHEFFHTWNGEALKPDSGSFQWFIEGATVFYSYSVLEELGIITNDQYKAELANRRSSYENNPYRKTVPIASAGNRDMLDKSLVSLMYDGGFLAAISLDSHLSRISSGKVRLIDVLRNIYLNKGNGGVIGEEALIDEVLKMTGYDISEFIEGLVHRPSPSFSYEVL